MRLRILGCSGGIGHGLRTTSYLLDEDILIDAGTGVGDIPPDRMCGIDHVFLTHSHLDHVVSLPLLIDTIFTCIETPLVVHAQPVTIEALKAHVFNWTIWPDFAELPDKDRPVVVFEPLEPGVRLQAEGYTFEMIPVEHVVPGVAYVVERDGRSFCFSGDTTTNDTLWEGLNARESLDLLLVECAFPDKLEELSRLAKHYCPKLLASDLKKLKHRPRVVITHLQPGHEDTIFAECEAQIEGFELIRATHGLNLDI